MKVLKVVRECIPESWAWDIGIAAAAGICGAVWAEILVGLVERCFGG